MNDFVDTLWGYTLSVFLLVGRLPKLLPDMNCPVQNWRYTWRSLRFRCSDTDFVVRVTVQSVYFYFIDLHIVPSSHETDLFAQLLAKKPKLLPATHLALKKRVTESSKGSHLTHMGMPDYSAMVLPRDTSRTHSLTCRQRTSTELLEDWGDTLSTKDSRRWCSPRRG